MFRWTMSLRNIAKYRTMMRLTMPEDPAEEAEVAEEEEEEEEEDEDPIELLKAQGVSEDVQ